ncbi:MAG: Gfo/Idh/MocA family protein, partial [Opitutaceae bacterium]
MFQMRVEPRYLKIRNLIRNGDLGEIVRVNWIITDWFRTEAYYASGGWRATWKGEGGGVLLNQCLHQLDMLQWLCGMPARVRGFCQLGRFHNIEVEDNITTYLEWANGATGVFISSTGEAPGTNRFEICGTRGKVVLENNRITFTRNDADMVEFSRTSKSGFAKPEVWNVEIPFDNAGNPHCTLIQNFVDAILDGSPLIAPGAEGMGSVELANVLLYSSLINQNVELPMDSAAWEKKLNELIAGSRSRSAACTPRSTASSPPLGRSGCRRRTAAIAWSSSAPRRWRRPSRSLVRAPAPARPLALPPADRHKHRARDEHGEEVPAGVPAGDDGRGDQDREVGGEDRHALP